MIKIANVLIPIVLDKEFDYYFSSKLKVAKGMRVLVDFKGEKRLGFVAGISRVSKVKNLKPIIDVLDAGPLLDKESIQFADYLSKIYPYSKAEFLFMMLPSYLKKIRRSDFRNITEIKKETKPFKDIFIKADSFLQRYQLWKNTVKEKLKEGSVLVCFPQLSYLLQAKAVLEKDFSCKIKLLHSQEKEKELFFNWKTSRTNTLIIGTRVSIFYYPHDLKLIVIEEENSRYYFQEEKPFHHILDVAFLLSKIKKAGLILSGDYPSLGTYKYIKEGKVFLENRGDTEKEIKVVNIAEFSKKKLIGPVLLELLRKTVQENRKAVVLWNKKGFAKIVSCSNCGYTFKCEHCSSFLQVSLKSNEGVCPYCRRKIILPEICGQCHQGRLRSIGYGIERIGSVLKRIFPEVKIDSWQDRRSDSQIILATSKILSYLYAPEDFDTGFVLDVDSFLARSDYDATLDAFFYLKKLSFLFKKDLYVFTNNKNYYLFQCLNEEWKNFYELELAFRKKLCLPPFGLIVKITLRAKNKNKLLKKAEDLYDKLKKEKQEVYGPFPERPFKLRDKFRYSLIIKAKRNMVSRRVIKEEVKGLRSSSVQLAVSLR